jgi:hypothetical protein
MEPTFSNKIVGNGSTFSNKIVGMGSTFSNKIFGMGSTFVLETDEDVELEVLQIGLQVGLGFQSKILKPEANDKIHM